MDGLNVGRKEGWLDERPREEGTMERWMDGWMNKRIWDHDRRIDRLID